MFSVARNLLLRRFFTGSGNPHWFVLAGVVLFAFVAARFPAGFPEQLANPVDFAAGINLAEDWLRDNYRQQARDLSAHVKGAIALVEEFLILRPWPVVVALFAIPAWVFGGLRLGLLIAIGVVFWGVLRLWEPAMQTLALMIVSVTITLLIGLPLGILAGTSRLAEMLITPVLDTMQTMPAFVYLVPAMFFFGVGGTTAVLATVVYAMPPVIRLTAHGLRATPQLMIETSDSFGATKWQILRRVRLPTAYPAIMVGINQTVMMALGLVVLASLIGAPGLGSEIWIALQKLNVGKALEGGICIVIMAIVIDRLIVLSVQYRMQASPAPSRRIPWVRSHVPHSIALILIALVIVNMLAEWLVGGLEFPKSLQIDIRSPVNLLVAEMAASPMFISLTKSITYSTYIFLLAPMKGFLLGMPWWFLTGIALWLAWLCGRWRMSGLALFGLVAVGVAGQWSASMETLASVFVSIAICALIGIPVAVWAGRNVRIERALRPVLDTMQTMPAFVYLVPVIMFFGGNIVSAMIATVIYALPPVIRVSAMGFRDIPKEIDEAVYSFGTKKLHAFWRVRLPLALPAIVVGLNQAIMMALAMQVITPLIGGGGLGREVYHALGLADSGQGLVAGLSIVMIAVVLDRSLKAWSGRKARALEIRLH